MERELSIKGWICRSYIYFFVYMCVPLRVRTKRGLESRNSRKGWGKNREEIYRKDPHRNTL